MGYSSKIWGEYSEEVRPNLRVNNIEELAEFGINGGTFLMPSFIIGKYVILELKDAKLISVL